MKRYLELSSCQQCKLSKVWILTESSLCERCFFNKKRLELIDNYEENKIDTRQTCSSR